MRIAFAGASGTGKTELAKYVAKTFDLPFKPSVSRKVTVDMGFLSPYDADHIREKDWDKIWSVPGDRENKVARLQEVRSPEEVGRDVSCRRVFQQFLWAAKLQEEGPPTTSWVADRSLFDLLVYEIQHLGYLWGNIRKRLDLAEQHADLIFYTPVSSFWNPGGDPMRLSDRGYAETTDLLLQSMLLKSHPQASSGDRRVTLTSKSLEARKLDIQESMQTILRMARGQS